jgi:hypothetical protein
LIVTVERFTSPVSGVTLTTAEPRVPLPALAAPTPINMVAPSVTTSITTSVLALSGILSELHTRRPLLRVTHHELRRSKRKTARTIGKERGI